MKCYEKCDLAHCKLCTSCMSCLLYTTILFIIFRICILFVTGMLNRGPLFKKQDLPAVPMKLIVSEALQLFFIISVQQKHIIKTLAIGHRL